MAIVTLKLESSEFSSKEVKNAAEEKSNTIQHQLKVCEEMIRIHQGAPQEQKCRKKMEKLFKDREKVWLS